MGIGYPPVTYVHGELMNVFPLGWGGVMRAVGGKPAPEESRHIGLLRMDAVPQLLQRLSPLLSGKDVLVRDK